MAQCNKSSMRITTMLVISSVLMSVGLATTFAQSTRGASSQTAGYAKDWELNVPADAAIVRLKLPAEVLGSMQTEAWRDVRVVNGEGDILPMALNNAADNATNTTTQQTVNAMPIYGAASRNFARTSEVLLRVDGNEVRINNDRSGAASQRLLGALFDTRSILSPPGKITLNVTLPEAQMVKFQFETSSDLEHWIMVGSATGYFNAGKLVQPVTVDMTGQDLKDRYLRVYWSNEQGDMLDDDAVTVESAVIDMLHTQNAIQVPLKLSLTDKNLVNSSVVEFQLPFATPLAAMDIQLKQQNTLIPASIYVRNFSEHLWQPLVNHTLFNMQRNDVREVSKPLALEGRNWKQWHIEANTGSSGFSSVPDVTVWFAPVELVFVASGEGPFKLLVGKDNAPNTYLPITSVIPDYTAQKLNQLPYASFPGIKQVAIPDSATMTDPVVAAAEAKVISDADKKRRMILWAVLIVGVLVLAGVSFVLLREKPPQN